MTTATDNLTVSNFFSVPSHVLAERQRRQAAFLASLIGTRWESRRGGLVYRVVGFGGGQVQVEGEGAGIGSRSWSLHYLFGESFRQVK